MLSMKLASFHSIVENFPETALFERGTQLKTGLTG